MAFVRRRACNAAVPSACFLLLVLLHSATFLLAARRGDSTGRVVEDLIPTAASSSAKEQGSSCEELQSISGGDARCAYLRARSPCSPAGYIDYLRLFYCGFASAPAAGYAALLLWLVVLFYLLGDTASEYFCASLEGLSAALRLPPTVAGVTLLSLGNGAPDVFASVVSFAAGDGGGVGLNSALGGALFVSTVVAGVIALAVGARGGVIVEWRGFVRDLCFLLLALCYLLAVLVNGEVTVWVAASFVSLYVGYVVLVWTSHCCAEKGKPPAVDLSAPLLLLDEDDADVPSLPSHSKTAAPGPTSRGRACLHCLLRALCMPLYLPRRLTIPDIAAHRWSRPCAVASAALAPVFIAATWTSQRNPVSSSRRHSLAVLLGGALLGLLLAVLAAATTDAASPPRGRRRRVPWLAAGFLMSVLWAYILARELVALLVTIGYMVGINASVLAVTVLAWGDSLGDLVSNVAMAVHGGAAGAQTAVSGCYAGPLFNTVVGLGLSLALAAGAQHPLPFVVPADGAAYEAMGFLGAALAWALFVVPVRGMRIDRVYGVGLIAIYLCFFAVRVFETLGLWT
ncbi:cation/calcium exchanger 1-like [Phragmites australis]|uniref:cation/calcium exchanger 1-like n=1 Tax=Phragmites australis TaxID=29695 RepID=UPI002D792169|nr:cation/calcium exchanger 1-like [Phragmites australis]